MLGWLNWIYLFGDIDLYFLSWADELCGNWKRTILLLLLNITVLFLIFLILFMFFGLIRRLFLFCHIIIIHILLFDTTQFVPTQVSYHGLNVDCCFSLDVHKQYFGMWSISFAFSNLKWMTGFVEFFYQIANLLSSERLTILILLVDLHWPQQMRMIVSRILFPLCLSIQLRVHYAPERIDMVLHYALL